jgi:flagellar hook-associated protein 2
MSTIAPASQSAPTATASSTVQSLGIGSGLDIATIVSQLTAAQGAAETAQLTTRQTDLQAQVSAYGTFRSALEALQATLAPLEDASKFQGRTATVGDATIASASADATATPAQYSIAVTSLASAANLVSAPVTNATVGTGTLAISVGGVTVKVTIDSTNNTLAGIAAAINSAVGNPGVNATVISTSGGDRLVLNGTKTGAINGITVTQSGGDGGLAQLAYDPANGINGANNGTGLTQVQAAQDAQFTINGFAATSPSNEVTGVIGGVTLNLLKPTAANTPTTLTVGYDQKSTESVVTNFVTAYNALITSVKALTSYDPTTKTAGTLLGNTTVNSLVAKLRSLLSQSITSSAGGAQTLADLGVTSNVSGGLDQDSTKLTAALTGNLSAVTTLLTGKNGIAQQLDNALNQYTQPAGLLDTINTGLQSGLTDVTSRQQALQLRLNTYSATLTKEFNAMDAAVAALKQTQSYLTQAFNSINGTKTTTTG